MARFRAAGTNWEGRPWRVSAAILSLLEQIQDVWPDRHPTDGTVASRGHDRNNPRSDHRPRPTWGAGVVRALDIGEVVEDRGELLAEQLRQSRDPRLKYVIHEGRIFSSYNHRDAPAWMWRRYRGSSFHLNHVHVSVTRGADGKARRWDIELGGEMAAVQVIDVQKALNEAGVTDHEDKLLEEDDVYGPRTAAALAKGFRAGVAIDGLTVVGNFTGVIER